VQALVFLFSPSEILVEGPNQSRLDEIVRHGLQLMSRERDVSLRMLTSKRCLTMVF
jgi:hypothetical protein